MYKTNSCFASDLHHSAACYSSSRPHLRQPLAPSPASGDHGAGEIDETRDGCGWRTRWRWSSAAARAPVRGSARSEEHTSELQSLMRISYAVFCLKKKKSKIRLRTRIITNK